MGTVINEVGGSAGGIAKVEYKDENGNVLWYYDDAGNFVRNGNAKITGLAGTGTRMVTADSSGNLSAGAFSYSESTYTPTLSSTGQTGSWTYIARYGRYIRIGNNLKIHLSIEWTSKPSAGTDVKISLPVSVDVYALRGFFGEYAGINFEGKQLSLSNWGTDSYNIYLFQNSSGGIPIKINVSDVSSVGLFNCVIETLIV